MSIKARLRSYLRFYRKQLLVLLFPLLFLPLLIAVPGKEAQSAYMVMIMACYWCSEAVPIPVTGLIPVFMLPLLGIMTVSDVTHKYMRTSTMLIVGGVSVAIGIEHVNLHKRIALRVLMTVGSQPQRIMLGFMLPTWLLSMWISNTATIAMMCSILEALITELESLYQAQAQREYVKALNDGVTQIQLQDAASTDKHQMELVESKLLVTSKETTDDHNTARENESNKPVEMAKHNRVYVNDLGKALTLSVYYAARIGGAATIIGSVNSVVGFELIQNFFSDHGAPSPLNFTTWMLLCLPMSFVLLLCALMWLQCYLLSWRPFPIRKKPSYDEVQKREVIRKIIEDEHKALGPMSFAEIQVGIIFVLLVLLWLLRDPGVIPGWGVFFKSGYVADAAPAVLMAFLMFFLPCDSPLSIDKTKGSAATLLSWNFVQKKFPWSVLFVSGGGYSLAASCEASGLLSWMSSKLDWLQELPQWSMLLLISFILSMLTEFISNSAASSLFMPLFGHMAVNMGMNPIFLMLPVNLCLSFAYMLPSSSTPAALIFSFNRITIKDMVKAGFILNVIGVFVSTLGIQTLGRVVFDLETVPWQQTLVDNITKVATNLPTTELPVTV